MIEELNAKILCSYFPYDLQLYGSSDIWTLAGVSKRKVTLINGLHIITHEIDDLHVDYDLLLHPLSDLWEIKDNEDSKRFSSFQLKLIKTQGIFNLSYFDVEYLISKHYDIFGLIEANLATDVNTLKK